LKGTVEINCSLLKFVCGMYANSEKPDETHKNREVKQSRNPDRNALCDTQRK
jgi:hypothetical protein